MGVQGLWKLLEPAGRPVALETLQGKVLAVDVSIWLHQALYGVRDSEGQAVSNAHLLVLFNRMCKLLYYGIKPIFVFDGATPTLKLKTLASRQQRRFEARKQSQKVAEKLLKNYMKSAVLGSTPTVPRPLLADEEVREDLFILPQEDCLVEQESISLAKVDHRLEEEEEEADEDVSLAPSVKHFYQDLSSLDIRSPSFATLPPEIQHELIAEKQRHDKEIKFRHLEEVPKEAGSFSAFQLNRLMSRSQLSRKMEDLRQVMATSYSADVGGGGRGEREVETRRIVSKAGSHYVLVRHTPSQSESEGEWESDSHVSSTGSVEVKGESAEVKGESSQVKSDIAGVQGEGKLDSDQSGVLVGAAAVEATEVNMSDTHLLLEQSHTVKDMQEAVCDRGGTLGPLVNADGGRECVEVEEDIQKAIYASFQIMDRSQLTASQHTLESGGLARPLASDDSLQEVGGVSEVVAGAEEPALTLSPGDASAGEGDSSTPLPPPVRSSEGACTRTPPKECESLLTDRGDTMVSAAVHDIGVVGGWPGRGGGEDEEEEVEVMSCSSSNEGEGEPLEKRQRVSVDSENSLDQPTLEHTAEAQVDKTRTAVGQDARAEADQEQLRFIHDIQEVGQEVLSQQLQRERQELMEEGGQMARYASEVNSQVYREAQDLLRLFGVPFITSPSEAESQCAWLDIHHPQVDGSITDDNDYLLFGGHHVYRHFFNQNRIAELYTNADIHQCLGLSQDQLILLAYFTGSDYTEGVQGVGVVTAVEILRDFPGKGIEVLQKFKAWHEAGSQLTAADRRLTGRQRKLLQVPLPPSFPDEQVMKAYLHPVVDDSSEHFSWATPDMHDLQQYAVSRFGWSEKKAKDTLAPVFKKMNESKPSSLQSKLSAHFNQPHFAWQRPSIASRRVQHAVARLKAAAREEEEETLPTSSGGGGAEGSSLRLSESSSSEEEGQWEGASSDSIQEPIIPPKHGRGRGRKQGPLSGGSAVVEKTSKGRGRGRGRGKGSGRGCSRGRAQKHGRLSTRGAMEDGETTGCQDNGTEESREQIL